jgi:hypothetical protein
MSGKPDELKRLHELIQGLVNCHSPTGAELEHDPEKWTPVFRKDHAQSRC